MATITLTRGTTLPDSSSKADFHNLVDNATATISGITNADIDSSAAIADSKLAQISTANKVKAGAITDEALNVAALTCDSVASAGNVTLSANAGVILTEGTAPSTAAGTGALYTKDTAGQPELFYREESSGHEVQITSAGAVASGRIVQVVNTNTGAVASGSTVMPFDDTVPQNTEGDEYMTLAVTPTATTNKLRIDVVANVANSATNKIVMGLFQDSTAGALAACATNAATSNDPYQLKLTHYMTAGTTSATTFKVRIGPSSSATVSFNGVGGARQLGGVDISSITITEIKV